MSRSKRSLKDKSEIRNWLWPSVSVSEVVVVLLLVMLVAFFSISLSYAKGCKANFSLYTGCIGEEGYVYVPDGYNKKLNPLCGGDYKIFKTDKLPSVGDVVQPYEMFEFYKNLEDINNAFKNCDLDAKDFKRKDLFGRNRDEAYECLMDSCMAYFDKTREYVTGNENILGEVSHIKILSYKKINGHLFALIKVMK